MRQDEFSDVARVGAPLPFSENARRLLIPQSIGDIWWLAALVFALLALGMGRSEAQVLLSASLNQASALGAPDFPCNGGGSATAAGGVLAISGSCGDSLGSSFSSVFAAPGSVGIYGSAVSFPSSISLPEVAGGTASYQGFVKFTALDPLATTAIVKLNLNFTGMVNSAGDFSSAQVRVNAALDGVLNGLVIDESGGNAPTCAETGMSGTGFCSGVSGSGKVSGLLTMVPIAVPLNTFIPVSFSLTASAGSALGGSAVADFSHTLSFANGSDVFTVDQGILVNSADSFIVDNHYIAANVPEPNAYGMLLAGLGMIGFFAMRRKNLRLAS